MKKRFAIILVLVQCVISVHAQDYSAPIFRGELAEKYAYNITGCVYAYSEEFDCVLPLYGGEFRVVVEGMLPCAQEVYAVKLVGGK